MCKQSINFNYEFRIASTIFLQAYHKNTTAQEFDQIHRSISLHYQNILNDCPPGHCIDTSFFFIFLNTITHK